ncbi:MAG: XRE family transcriptional regulator [Comamonadaceae bacterium CG12_big_fil_rev_8_21_14_0_65_59_15]|nr:MAG: XRE family transcriptional regulator [Comamonadaceae bacterium CG12_big_fil_rev_8_21_14_0_65_59_15]
MRARANTVGAGIDGCVDIGTGNVFVDLGFSDPEDRQLRVQLATRLNDLIQADGLTQSAAAKALGVAQSLVSELKNYKLSRFTSDQLVHCIKLLNGEVEVFVPRSSTDTVGNGSLMARTAV